MMNQIFARLMLCMVATFLVAGCGSSPKTTKNNNRLIIQKTYSGERLPVSEVCLLAAEYDNSSQIVVISIDGRNMQSSSPYLRASLPNLYELMPGEHFVIFIYVKNDGLRKFTFPNKKISFTCEANKIYELNAKFDYYSGSGGKRATWDPNIRELVNLYWLQKEQRKQVLIRSQCCNQTKQTMPTEGDKTKTQ